ncbi:MAG: hypothetical protein ABI927_08380 [Gaiellaceae bacterium]
MSVSSNRNAIIGAVGWWYAKRLFRKRGAAALAGLTAGDRKRRPMAWLLVASLIAGGGFLWWRREQNDSVKP